MSVQLSHIVGGVLDYCHHAISLTRAVGLVAERTIDVLAYYVNQISQSHENWHLEKTNIYLTADTIEYSINATAWGKPVTVYELDENGLLVGDVQIVRFQDQEMGHHTNLPGYVSAPAQSVGVTRASITFFSESGQWKARVTPTPTGSSTLVVYYEPTTLSVSQLQSVVPFLANYSNLLKKHSALVNLPYAEWEGFTRAENKEQRDEIRKGLEPDFALLSAQFEDYRLSLFQEQTSQREGFGDEFGYMYEIL